MSNAPAPRSTRPALMAALLAATSSGCGLPQSARCEQFVACQRAVDPSVDTSAYEPEGRCWVNPRTAALCDAQCEEALDALEDVPNPPEACRS